MSNKIKKQNIKKSPAVSIAILLVVFALAFVGCSMPYLPLVPTPPAPPIPPGEIIGVEADHGLSLEEFNDLIGLGLPEPDGEGGWDTEDGDASGPASPPNSAPGEESDYASTNTQVDGVDEGDIIKVDAGFIYTLNRNGLTIVDISSPMRVSFTEEYTNFFPDEMFIFDNLLIVIGGEFSEIRYDTALGGEALIPWWGFRTGTRIIVYNIENRWAVERLGEYNIAGSFITSRRIGNNLIVLTNYFINRFQPETFFPLINGEPLSHRYVHIHGTDDFSSHLIMASLNLNSLNLSIASHLGLRVGSWNSTQYFSQNSVYFFVGSTRFSENYTVHTHYSHIIKINLNSLRLSAKTTINGLVTNRFWVSEYRNNLRVVSQTFTSGRGNQGRNVDLLVLNSNLVEVGKIEGFALGQTIHGVRFRGDIGVVDTYILIDIRIDSVTRLDISDIRNPTHTSGTPEAGVNDYLQFLTDDIVLGLGRNTITQNGFTSFQGIQVSLYRNENGTMTKLHSITLGNHHVNSEALFNHLAILNDPARNMFSFPIFMGGPPRTDGRIALEGQGLAVFEYNLNTSNPGDMLIYRGLLTNVPTNHVYNDWWDYLNDSFSFVQRGARIGNRIFTISERYITSYDIHSLQLLERLQLNVDICHFGHRWEQTAWVSATCTQNGFWTRICRTCGKEERHTLYSPGHQFGAWTITTMPGPNGGGIETRRCWGNCGLIETRPLENHVLVDGLLMRYSDGGYTIIEYRSSSSVVNIPSYHNGIPIVEIASGVFSGNWHTLRNITAVNFAPNSRLQTIGSNAFSDTRVTSIIIPSSVTTIGSSAFSRTHSSTQQILSSIAFEAGSSLTSIGSRAFFNTRITSFTIPDSVSFVGNGAFSNNINLTSLYIGRNVSTLWGNIANNSPNLTSLVVSSENTSMHSYNNTVIRSSDNLLIMGASSAIIPDYVTAIGDSAFSGMNLTSVVIPSTVKWIGSGAFSNNANLAVVDLSAAVYLESIGSNAFNNTISVTSIEIPYSVFHVAPWAFNGWQSSQTIRVLSATDTLSATVNLGVNWRAGSNATIRYGRG